MPTAILDHPKTRKRSQHSTAQGQTTEDVAADLGVSAPMVDFYRSQLRSLLGGIVKAGMKPRAAIELATEEALPLLEQEAPGYASPEEGLADLIHAEGGCVSVSEAVKLYRRPKAITNQAMTRLIRDGNVIAYQTGSGSYSIPKWQFKPTGGIIDGLPAVLAKIRELIPEASPIEPFAILLQEHPLTDGETPLNALKSGRVDEVLEVVEAYANE